MRANLPSLRNLASMLLVAAALLLQAAIPHGYMLGKNEHGEVIIQLCDSYDAIASSKVMGGHAAQGDHAQHQAHADHAQHSDHSDHSDHGDDHTTKICAFAGLQLSADHADPNLHLPLPQLAQASYDAVREQALSPASPRLSPPARGPPTLA